MSDNKTSKGFDFNKELETIKKDRNLAITTGGALALIVGLFLPWYTITAFKLGVSFNPGLGDSTGIFLLVLAVVSVGALLNVLNQDKKTMAIVAIVASAFAVLIMFNNWPDSTLAGAVSTGIGYWLSLAGSAAMVAGSVLSRQKPVSGTSSKEK